MNMAWGPAISLVLFSCYILSVTAKQKAICPKPDDIQPCICTSTKDKKVTIVCDDITNDEELAYVMQAAKKHKLFGIQLKSITLQFIPDNAFSGSGIQSIEIENSGIFSLSESEVAFKGLEESLKHLRVENCSFVNNWAWTQFQHLKELTYLEIASSNLLELTEEFYTLSHLPLVEIIIRDNFIDYLPYRVFGSFSNLKKLTLNSNKLSEIMRSMLPVPARKLETIGLNNNRIKRLPANAFTDMPSLKYVLLGGNPLHTIEKSVFQPLWPQLWMALFHDSPIVCDCLLFWITQTKHAKQLLLSGKCSFPINLKGKSLHALTSDDFLC